jgi:hypothetical protein
VQKFPVLGHFQSDAGSYQIPIPEEKELPETSLKKGRIHLKESSGRYCNKASNDQFKSHYRNFRAEFPLPCIYVFKFI